ncbi:alpha/beta hydrolase [Actinokineospora auranticolor]|uniref:alpha/beta fold hydrolase n=1 Tax=Actinokineospora auranticolor TaxID=155976 RepID=UPI0015E2D8D4|nr:alpha/beta hydrolase [Actinokineospora auranticolor]
MTLVLSPLLWLLAGIRPRPWLLVAALAVDVVFLIEALGDLGWFLDQDKLWLHVVLTVLPAAVVGAWTLPRVIRGSPVDPWPAVVAAVAAVVNAYFAVVPHERVTFGVLAFALVPAVVVLAVILPLRGRGRVARIAVGIGATLALAASSAVAAIKTSTVTGYDAEDSAAARAKAEQVPVRTGHVTSEGDTLYYEVRGCGPPLLMISGGQGDAGFYTYPAALLADEFQVITYDRRGNSRSTRNVTDFSIAQQARDAVAVLRAAGHESAAIFGNSGGAIIALEMATSTPAAATAVIAHEPPLLTVEPDTKSLAMFDTIRRLGAGTGMALFSLSVGIPVAAYREIPADFTARTANNQRFFAEHEMAHFVRYAPNVERLKSSGIPVVMAVGATTLATRRYYGPPAGILAGKIGAPLVVFPGHHLSYFDVPVAWTAKLRDTLHDVRRH